MTRVTEIQIDRETESGDTEIELEFSEMEKEIECEFEKGFQFIEELEWEYETNLFEDSENIMEFEFVINQVMEEIEIEEELEWEYEKNLFEDCENIGDTVTMLLEAKIDQKIHPHNKGQKGHGVRKKQEDFKVDLRFPPANDTPDIIMITDEEDNVFDCKDHLLNIEEEFGDTVTMLLEAKIDQKIHPRTKGQKGHGVKKKQEDFMVDLRFPPANDTPDIIMITDEEDNVLDCKDHLLNIEEEFGDTVTMLLETKIDQKIHPHNKGQKGHGVKKKQEDFKVDLRFPPANDTPDIIMITDEEDNVFDCKDHLLNIEEEFGDTVTMLLEAKIDQKIHPHNKGQKGHGVRKKQEDFKVDLRFPPANDTPDIIMITDEEDNVFDCKDHLLNIEEEFGDTVTMLLETKIDQKIHPHNKGQKGHGVKKKQEDFKVDLRFPPANDTPDIIMITDEEDNVFDCKDDLLNIEEEFGDTVTMLLEAKIDQKIHPGNKGQKGHGVKKKQEDFKVDLRFPPANDTPDIIMITDEEDNVFDCKDDLLNIEEEFGDTVTMLLEAKIDQKIHPHNKGQKGHGVRKKQEDFKVDLRFPPANDTPDIIMITDEEDNVFDCKDHLLNIEEEFGDTVTMLLEAKIDQRIHPRNKGQKGHGVRKKQEDFKVDLRFPPANDTPDIIMITDEEDNVFDGKDHLLNIEEEFGDTVTMLLEAKIDQRIHPRNKGQKGHGVRKKQEDFKVDLRFPPANDTPDIIMITDEEDNVFDCKDHLLNIEEEFGDTVTMLLEAKIDQRIHPRNKGQKGHGVRKKQEDFKVDLRFPPANDTPDIIMITDEEDNVFDCKDHLLNIEEEFLQDLLYNEYIQSLTKTLIRNQDSQPTRGKASKVVNAPWDAAPDNFPSFPGATEKTRGPLCKPSLVSKKIQTC